MTSQLMIRLDSDLKSRFQKLAQTEGKSTSEVVRNLIETYIQDRDMQGAIDNLWNRVGTDLTTRGVSLPDIDRAIQDVRAKKQ